MNAQEKRHIEDTDAKLKAYERQRSSRVLMAGTGLLAVFVALVLNTLYISYAIRQNDQRWCDLITGLDDNYRAIPAPARSPRVERFTRQISELRKGLHCSPPGPLPAVSPSDTRLPVQPSTEPTRG